MLQSRFLTDTRWKIGDVGTLNISKWASKSAESSFAAASSGISIPFCGTILDEARFPRESSEMTSIQQRRDWIWVAVIAIGITLLSPAVRPVNSAAARDKSLSLSVPAASSVGAEIAIGKRVGRSLRALLQFQQNHGPDRGAWVVYQPVQFVGLEIGRAHV